MIKNIPINNSFKTYFVSRESTNNPLSIEIIKIVKKLHRKEIGSEKNITVSLSYGKRILITTMNIDIDNINNQDITEIVDFNPIKNIVLAIGKKDPNIEIPVHWIIHNAKREINAIIQIDEDKLIKKYEKILPITEKEFPAGSLDLAKEILKKLKISKEIIIKNKGCLFTGINLKEIENSIFKGENEINES
jgi:ribulose-5-phosphate 4-epimerase/fuculose-1-phosphate aldolase